MEGYLGYSLAGSPSLTWTQFSRVFLGNYMPCSLREHLADQFLRVEKVFLAVQKYEDLFHEIARHVIIVLLT